MGFWEDRVVPRLVETACGTGAIHRWRRLACAGLGGRVLEIGFGSGLNLGHLPDEVGALVAVEPSDLGWERSAGRRAATAIPVERAGLDGQALPLPDASVDGALCTFTLCTIPDPALALAEVRRVLRPGGTLHVLEHGLSPDAGVARWQHRLDPVERLLAGGCRLTRDVPAMLAGAGFEVEIVRQQYLPGPAVLRPWAFGTLALARQPG